MKILIAGVGNIFLSDDAFGVELAQRLMRAQLPAGVQVKDYGLRSLHLAYDLLENAYDLAILLDTTQQGGAPGTLYVIEPELETVPGSACLSDAHSVNPDAIFSAIRSLGGAPGRMLLVGCEPASLEEGMTLSPPVAAAVEEAVRLISDLLARQGAEGEPDVSGDSRPNRALAT
ncbi:MAG: hydrogenase maturation protease [Candidatus Solibacter sp.]